MKEPTEAQVKEFWGKCGVKKPPCDRVGGCMKKIDSAFSCECDKWEYPLIDPNNLFKYAVPKLSKGERWVALFHFIVSIDNDKDPALALFREIWEVIK